MKTKYILLTLLCLTIVGTTEAQLLKKIKKTAERAAEQTVLKKTDEIVTEKTEKTIDNAANGNENNTDVQNQDSKIDSSRETNYVNSDLNPMGSKGNDTSRLPASYIFDWEFKTEMTSSNGDNVQMNYLLNSNNIDYAGMEMSTDQSRQQGTVLMVMDAKAKTIIMFMNANGQKMAQMTELSDSREKTSDEEFTFREIGTKTILGYKCFGIEVENKGYKATMYYTLDAPVSFNSFFSFTKNSTPKGFDPALIEVLKEEALLMEMHAIDKKKNKDSYTMIAKSLNKKDSSIKKEEYQFMKMGF